jgi:hypothetical protein
VIQYYNIWVLASVVIEITLPIGNLGIFLISFDDPHGNMSTAIFARFGSLRLFIRITGE